MPNSPNSPDSSNNTWQQKTIAKQCRFTGIALHSGGEVNVALRPAAINSGIVFTRTDVNMSIKSSYDKVGDTLLATVLSQNGHSVMMVEHLLSALSAAGIDNLIVEIDGKEMPILDGSAIPWIVLLDSVGIVTQPAPKKYIRVTQAVEISEGDRVVSLSPTTDNAPSFDIYIDYPHKIINNSGQHYQFNLSYTDYKNNISRARTFCHVADVPWMQRNNRALGGSLQNAIVYDNDKIINANGLRYPNEFVRHKVLDAIGDCYIDGHWIIGHYKGIHPGHDLNNKVIRALFTDSNNWQWSTTP